MKTQNPEVKKKLQTRLLRIEGQVRGVKNMLDEGRDCSEIMQQLSAIRSAVQSATLLFVREQATDCLVNHAEVDLAQRSQMVNDLVSLIEKAT